MSGPMVPLITALTKTNKIVMLEKFSFILTGGPGNSTHAYELDYSVTDPARAFREMHPKTDVFCSAIHMMPDAAGRILNVGGMRDEALSGVRVYFPSNGTAGGVGFTDWEERSGTRLQVPRWYAGMIQLQNGSFAIVGGCQNADLTGPSPSVEILPANSFKPVEIPMLRETGYDNLYPFTFMLPSGRILLIAERRAALLNQQTFQAERELPRIPGNPSGRNSADTDGVGGRTYPTSGAAVLLPLLPPYTAPVEVLICGGSEGKDGHGVENCVRIQPDVENVQWEIERMPFRRVMPNLVALPDLTFLIVNGAQRGLAGFGCASEPEQTALIYNPFRPPRQRISKAAWTSIARMYHSEAQLLHDGRVLISGSDPLDARFPEEYRLEFFYPPYFYFGIQRPILRLSKSVNTTFIQHGTSIRTKITFSGGNATAITASLISREFHFIYRIF
ncbi:hypothetical protein HDU97_000875 [Phlyctochytrium planicorne]|nr:hypothetical protein HDU97_000875 [Phlyctochytrium planicorne]